jgi:hypothetical protein
MLGGVFLAAASAQNNAQVLTLPEIIVTSFRGRLGTGKTLNGGTPDKHAPPVPGQAFTPLRLPPGTRLDVDGLRTSHAIISFPGIGGCMITEGSSLRLPEVSEPDMTVTFDRHISGTPNLMFLNINAVEMAKRGGAVFRTKNKYQGNSARSSQFINPNLVFSTKGGRFFIIDEQNIASQDGGDSTAACTVGILDGNATVEELISKQQTLLKPGQVVVITTKGIGAPRSPTKAELSYDIGCKLAALGREVPALLPPTMKTSAPTNAPGTKVNSLGMVFVPVPGTKILMCVHETRWQDFAPYLASVPPLPDGKQRAFANGHWGWDDHPVTTSWDEAQAFCAWLSAKEGKKYRLPTDEEWSRAAGIAGREKRGTGTTPEDLSKDFSAEILALRSNSKDKKAGGYVWGNEWPPPPASGNFGDASFHALHASTPPDKELALYDDGFTHTAPVMSFKPNKLGIYDLAGNVAEWCDDWYNNARQGRVVRGTTGYRADTPSYLHPSYRSSLPTDQALVAGFRIVIEQP